MSYSDLKFDPNFPDQLAPVSTINTGPNHSLFSVTKMSSEGYSSSYACSATTLAYTDPGSDQDIFYDDTPSGSNVSVSSNGTQAEFLENFKCHICELLPTLHQAHQFAPLWVAGESKSLVVTNTEDGACETFFYCQLCDQFFHKECILQRNQTADIKQVAQIALSYLEGNYIPYRCVGCQD